MYRAAPDACAWLGTFPAPVRGWVLSTATTTASAPNLRPRLQLQCTEEEQVALAMQETVRLQQGAGQYAIKDSLKVVGHRANRHKEPPHCQLRPAGGAACSSSTSAPAKATHSRRACYAPTYQQHHMAAILGPPQRA